MVFLFLCKQGHSFKWQLVISLSEQWYYTDWYYKQNCTLTQMHTWINQKLDKWQFIQYVWKVHTERRLCLSQTPAIIMYIWLKHKKYSFIVICTLQKFYIILCLAFFNYFNCLWFKHAHIYAKCGKKTFPTHSANLTNHPHFFNYYSPGLSPQKTTS